MIITIEMSLYPLKNTYEEDIITFIRDLKRSPDLIIFTTAMSTYVKGESQIVFDTIHTALTNPDLSLEKVLTMKIITRDLPVEQGHLSFG